MSERRSISNASRSHPAPIWRSALTGGEDYKLLFTAAPEALPALCRAFESRFGRPLYPIGTVTEAEDDTIVWLDCGRRVETDWRGYEHNA